MPMNVKKDLAYAAYGGKKKKSKSKKEFGSTQPYASTA